MSIDYVNDSIMNTLDDDQAAFLDANRDRLTSDIIRLSSDPRIPLDPASNAIIATEALRTNSTIGVHNQTGQVYLVPPDGGAPIPASSITGNRGRGASIGTPDE